MASRTVAARGYSETLWAANGLLPYQGLYIHLPAYRLIITKRALRDRPAPRAASAEHFPANLLKGRFAALPDSTGRYLRAERIVPIFRTRARSKTEPKSRSALP